LPSVQPTLQPAIMYCRGSAWPQRLKDLCFQQLLESNSWIRLVRNFPVEDISPFKTFFAPVARQDAKDFPAAGFQWKMRLVAKNDPRHEIWAAKRFF